MKKWLMVICCFYSFHICNASELPSLTKNGLNEWEPKLIVGETTYQNVDHKDRMALRAISDNSASGLILKQRIDLLDTPYIHWSWLIEKVLPPLDEHSKSGDDYAARVYVVIDGGFMLWKTKSLSYVWSGSQDKGEVWDNAFTGANVQMISVRGQTDGLGQWHDEKRNVYEDLIRYFGDKGSDKANKKAYRYIDIVAIMTDTDNSGSQAESYYGDIRFSTQ